MRDSPTKFCPKCRESLGGRVKALQLQVEEGRPIQDIIVQAGRAAFDSYVEDGRDVIGRFSKNLGIQYEILHEWLRAFFGLSWPDWKRRYICAAHSCSVVDVSRVRTTRPHRYSKYYPIEKLREKGVCSCPILGDDLILIDRRPQDLTPPALTNLFRRELPWFERMQVVSGSHLPMLDRQEER